MCKSFLFTTRYTVTKYCERSEHVECLLSSVHDVSLVTSGNTGSIVSTHHRAKAVEAQTLLSCYMYFEFRSLSSSIGGLVVKLAVAIQGDQPQMIRPAPGSIPGRCIEQLAGAHHFASVSSYPSDVHGWTHDAPFGAQRDLIFSRVHSSMSSRYTLVRLQDGTHRLDVNRMVVWLEKSWAVFGLERDIFKARRAIS